MEVHMKNKLPALVITTVALATLPLTPAHAEGWHHHGGGYGGHGGDGLFWGVTALGVAAVGAAVAIATAPFRIIGEAAAPPPPTPVYATPYASPYPPTPYPAPVYYAPAPAYQQRPVVVYSYPQYYGYPQ